MLENVGSLALQAQFQDSMFTAVPDGADAMVDEVIFLLGTPSLTQIADCLAGDAGLTIEGVSESAPATGIIRIRWPDGDIAEFPVPSEHSAPEELQGMYCGHVIRIPIGADDVDGRAAGFLLQRFGGFRRKDGGNGYRFVPPRFFLTPSDDYRLRPALDAAAQSTRAALEANGFAVDPDALRGVLHVALRNLYPDRDTVPWDHIGDLMAMADPEEVLGIPRAPETDAIGARDNGGRPSGLGGLHSESLLFGMATSRVAGARGILP